MNFISQLIRALKDNFKYFHEHKKYLSYRLKLLLKLKLSTHQSNGSFFILKLSLGK